MIDKNKTYIGVVEDNLDPSRIGRVKVRVLNVYDMIDIEDIPWASPWKDISGDEFSVPENGKVVTVVFESGDIKTPEYIYSEHYNINLESKLKDLDESDYKSMKSLIFDHKTQIYTNDSEGLKLDHKFNLINIKDKSIDLNIKDNYGRVNIGSSNANQRSILGDNFIDWFDSFIDILINGSHLGNMNAPITATPEFIKVYAEYKALKNSKLLSKNIYMVDNDKVDKLDRISNGQIGDEWNSTVLDNNITDNEPIDFKSVDGYTDSTFEVDDNGVLVSDSPISDINNSNDVTIDVLLDILNKKGYTIYSRPNEVNIISVRNQCIKPGDKYSDQFIDNLYIMYMDNNGDWIYKVYNISTVPGLKFNITNTWLKEKNLNWFDKVGTNIYMKDYITNVGDMRDNEFKKGLTVLTPSQYIDTYYISTYKGEKSMNVISGAKQYIWRDSDVENIDEFNPSNLYDPELIVNSLLLDNGLKIHRGYPGGKSVGNWSEGSQVFSNENDLKDFFDICNTHRSLYGNKFTYTLVTKEDWYRSLDDINENRLNNSPFNNNDDIGDGIGDIVSVDIVVLNPTSDVMKSVRGVVNIDKSSYEYTVTGVLNGLPNGVIEPLILKSSSRDDNFIISDMLSKLELIISNEYGVTVKLVTI